MKILQPGIPNTVADQNVIILEWHGRTTRKWLNFLKHVILDPEKKLTITNYTLYKAVFPRKSSVNEIKLCIQKVF